MQNTKNTASNETYINVWDIPVRLFHWILVVGFSAAYLTAQYHKENWHMWIGYALCLLLVARLVWGFIGGRYARFSSFIFSVDETVEYVHSMFKGDPRHYFGHNPAGAWMVFALLALLALICLTGMTTLAVIDFDGPLLPLTHHISDQTSYAIQEIHEFFANAILALIALHFLGVVFASLLHRENLALAMITGKKPNQHSPIKENMR